LGEDGDWSKRGCGDRCNLHVPNTKLLPRSRAVDLTRLIIAFVIAVLSTPTRAGADADAASTDVLAVERGLAASGAVLPLPDALGAQFAGDVVMQLPTGTFARGKDAAVAALRADPAAADTPVRWQPSGGGVSADGTHAFTYGVVTVGGDTAPAAAKYLAYWTLTPAGWRVAAYKQLRITGATPKPMAFHVLPTGMALPPGDHRTGLLQAERDFAADAQLIGLGPAFRKHGSPDAVNLGTGDGDFVVGNDAIARFFGGAAQAAASPVDWSPDEGAIVASSGDLGVNIGYIWVKVPPRDGRDRVIPFFTVWHRAAPDAPWRYVAE
jgi:ketosteroid isomerase-like protein